MWVLGVDLGIPAQWQVPSQPSPGPSFLWPLVVLFEAGFHDELRLASTIQLSCLSSPRAGL